MLFMHLVHKFSVSKEDRLFINLIFNFCLTLGYLLVQAFEIGNLFLVFSLPFTLKCKVMIAIYIIVVKFKSVATRGFKRL